MKYINSAALAALSFLMVTQYGLANSNDSSRINHLPKHAIKIGPLHPLNFYPTLQIGYEYRLLPNLTSQIGLGYAIPYHDIRMDFQNKRGVKLRLESRYYIPATVDSRNAHYLSAQFYSNIINFDRETQRIECFDLDCTIQYSKWYEYKVKYREQGLALQYGIHWYKRRVTFDLSIGVSLRHINYKEPTLPRGLNEIDEWAWFKIPNEENRTVIGPAGAFWIGYKIQQAKK